LIFRCEGKRAIHPSQIDLANEVKSPGAGGIEGAKCIPVAMAEAGKAGKGAVSLHGRGIPATLCNLAGLRQL
jgi:malyl-CoA/(S)-citramalyl-CoA lyase